VLLLREVVASRGLGAAIARAAERLLALAHGTPWQPFHRRDIAEWTALLQASGFTRVRTRLAWRGALPGALLEARH
jgi:hypothetical protein